ncbi:hypothetical protein B0T14DRAFT_80092 [Immersiella caudata]|uniref:Uncharacterized protein n=1 Tax=Immersiella caudata TaxID=314043 RepID=A0AA39XI34_9PEZI|nr:hypothetical protein B0T14DRAFT_80092 [Immersiella caudata]
MSLVTSYEPVASRGYSAPVPFSSSFNFPSSCISFSSRRLAAQVWNSPGSAERLHNLKPSVKAPRCPHPTPERVIDTCRGAKRRGPGSPSSTLCSTRLLDRPANGAPQWGFRYHFAAGLRPHRCWAQRPVDSQERARGERSGSVQVAGTNSDAPAHAPMSRRNPSLVSATGSIHPSAAGAMSLLNLGRQSCPPGFPSHSARHAGRGDGGTKSHSASLGLDPPTSVSLVA